MKIGYYSEKQAEFNGSSFYSTPDGGEVLITCVADEGKPHGCGYDDIVCVGPVVEYLREGKGPQDDSKFLSQRSRDLDPFGFDSRQ